MRKTIGIKQLNQFLYGALIVTLNFGEAVKIGSITLSWLPAILLIFGCGCQVVVQRRLPVQFKEKRVVYFLCAFWAVYLIIQSLWSGMDESYGQSLLQNYLNIFLCFVICYLIDTDWDFNVVSKFICVAFAINMGVAIYEITTGNHFIFEGISYWDREHVRTFFGNPNDCATWIGLAGMYTAFFLAKEGKRAWQIVIVCGITIYLTAMTGSRGGLYATITFVLFILMGRGLLYFAGKHEKRIKYIRVICAVLIIVFLLALGAFILETGGILNVLSMISG